MKAKLVSRVSIGVVSRVVALLVLLLGAAPSTALAGGGKLPPLAISKSGPPTIKPGEIINYDITVTETAGRDYYRVDITEVIPPYLTYVSGSPGCGYKGGRLGCWIDGVWPRMTKSFWLKFKVADNAPCNFQLVNQVDVVAKNADPNWAKATTVIKCEQKKQCSDGIDNDGDGWVDLDDCGCVSADGDNEANTNSPRCKKPQCSDGKDNDGDGWIDLEDSGCTSPDDDDESNPVPECRDGKDNDGDGWIDLEDSGCSSPDDDDEGNPLPQCRDGKDNDGDGWIDLEDSGCSSPDDDDESNSLPQCKDGKDNDGDGWIDLEDSGCSSPNDDDESNPIPQCKDGKDNDGDGKIDFPADPGCSSPHDDDEWNQTSLPQCRDGIDNDGDGWIDLEDSGCSSPDDNDESNPLPQCKDGIDNDGDGWIDLEDSGCSSPDDNDESDNKKQCEDGKDNDGDGKIDFPADPGCDSAKDNDESNGSISITKTGPATVSAGALIGYTVTVTNPTSSELKNVTVSDTQQQHLTYVPEGSGPGCTFTSNVVRCGPFNLAPGQTKVFTLNFKLGKDTPCNTQLLNQADVSAPGADPNWAKAFTTVSCKKQCDDGKDNDGDGKIDFPADPGCDSKEDDDEWDSPVSPVLPLLECVYDLGNGTYRAYFGYENVGATTVDIPAGTDTQTTLNKFFPDPKNRGQVSQFKPGRTRAAFFVDFDGSEIQWRVRPANGATNTASATKHSVACKPVKPIAECADKKSGKLEALFGYQNDNPFEIAIAIGDSNIFVPAPADRGQPNRFFPGRVKSVFNVLFGGGELTWKLGTQQTSASASLPLCTPNKGPSCDAGGPYVPQCQGSQTTINLDGTGSKDPDGQALTYKWSSDCQGASINDATAAQPVLNINTSSGAAQTCKVSLTVSDGSESSSCSEPIAIGACNLDCNGVPNGGAVLDKCGVCGGNNACLDCNGVANGGAVVDRCGVCGGNDACVDCNGVVNGTAKLDRCNVCNGDGNSCLGCSSTDITNLQFALDHQALLQKRLVDRAAKKVSRLPGADKGTKALTTRSTKEADVLYQESWKSTWSLPPQVVNCTNTEICSQNDQGATLQAYNTNSAELRDLALNLSRECSSLTKNDGSQRSRKMCRDIADEANELYEASVQILSQVPRFSSTCS